MLDVVPHLYYRLRFWRAYEPNPYVKCSKPRSIDARDVRSQRLTHSCVVLVNVAMRDAHSLDEVGGNWQVQIDGETWRELTGLFERVVDTLGLIAPVLELAKDKNEKGKLRHYRAVTDLAFRGQRALKAFSQRWAVVQEESLKGPATKNLEDFADIYVAARRFANPNPSPNSDSREASA
jgi:hypothetical protein